MFSLFNYVENTHIYVLCSLSGCLRDVLWNLIHCCQFWSPWNVFIPFIYSYSRVSHIFLVTVWTLKLVRVQSYTTLIVCHKSMLTIATHKPKLWTEIFYTSPTISSTFYCTWCIKKQGKIIIHFTVWVLNFTFSSCGQYSVKFSAPHETLRWLESQEFPTHPDMQNIRCTHQIHTTSRFEFENISTWWGPWIC